jgi:hypothetical protein
MVTIQGVNRTISTYKMVRPGTDYTPPPRTAALCIGGYLLLPCCPIPSAACLKARGALRARPKP